MGGARSSTKKCATMGEKREPEKHGKYALGTNGVGSREDIANRGSGIAGIS